MSGGITKHGLKMMVSSDEVEGVYVALLTKLTHGMEPPLEEPGYKSGYRRVPTNPNTWEVKGHTVTNKEPIRFIEAWGNWGEVYYIALVDSPKVGEGHILAYAETHSPIIGRGDTVAIGPGDLTITIEISDDLVPTLGLKTRVRNALWNLRTCP